MAQFDVYANPQPDLARLVPYVLDRPAAGLAQRSAKNMGAMDAVLSGF